MSACEPCSPDGVFGRFVSVPVAINLDRRQLRPARTRSNSFELFPTRVDQLRVPLRFTFARCSRVSRNRIDGRGNKDTSPVFNYSGLVVGAREFLEYSLAVDVSNTVDSAMVSYGIIRCELERRKAKFAVRATRDGTI